MHAWRSLLVRRWKILLLDELGGHDLHLLNMKHHGVQMNLHSGALGARFGEEDGATRNRTPPWMATKYVRRPWEKGLRHRWSINTEVAWTTWRLPRGLTLSEKALQWHWARRMDDGFLQELGNTVCWVSYRAKRGRKGSIDGFITSTHTSTAVSRTAVKQLVVPAAAAACLHG